MYYTNYIIIEHADKRQVESALKELANIYSNTKFVFGIQIFKHKTKNVFQIKFNEQPDFEKFTYFINFLGSSTIFTANTSIRGFWTITDIDNVNDSLNGKRIMLFNPESESESTYVFGVTSDNKTFKFAYAIDEGIRSLNKKLIEFNEPEFKESEFFFHKEISPIDLSLYYSESKVKGWKSIFYISNLLKLLVLC